MIELSILVPVLQRPQNVEPLINSVWEATTGVSFQIVFITSNRDGAERNEVERMIGQFGSIIEHFTLPGPMPGDYARKINFAYLHTTAEWLFLAADDIKPHPDWFINAKRLANATGKRVIGTQDLGNARVLRGEHSTHTLVHRTYVEEWGTIDQADKVLHEGYPHEFVDDEFIETASHRNEFVFCHDSVVEHLHPLWGKSPTDRLYQQHNKRMNQGRRIYMARKRMWA